MARPPREEVIIVDALPEVPTRYNPALSTVDRLLHQSTLETQSLRVVRAMMMRETEQRALVTGPKKLLQASNLRAANGNGASGHFEPEEPKSAKPRTRKSGKWARAKEEKAKTSISGKRLTLFILEHLDDTQKRGALYLLDQLAQAGSPVKGINGVLGRMADAGLIKFTKGQGYRLLAPGAKYAPKFRAELESTGQCIKNGYLAPPDYTTRIPLKRRLAQQQQQQQATH